MFTYSIHIEPQAEGGFVASIPNLPGCITEGETIEEALVNIEDAAKGYLHVPYKHNQDIPASLPTEHKISLSAKEFINA